MIGVGDLTEVEQQLLVAAASLGLGSATDISTVNTLRVVNQVLRWRGYTNEQIQAGWREDDCAPEHEAVYEALVRMTRQICRGGGFRPPERPRPALVEGGGNWGVPGDPECPPCWPHFNSCRLTAEGERVAKALSEQFPEWRKGAELGAR